MAPLSNCHRGCHLGCALCSAHLLSAGLLDSPGAFGHLVPRWDWGAGLGLVGHSL